MSKVLLTPLLMLFIVSASHVVDSLDPVTTAAIIKTVQEDAAPFKKTALERLHANIFGEGRAARSTDVVVINKTGKSFILQKEWCSEGGWTKEALPEHEIPPRTSVIYGAESYGFLTGLNDCMVIYRSTDGEAEFDLSVDNPYFGTVGASSRHRGVRVSTVKARGNNNNVRFTIHD